MKILIVYGTRYGSTTEIAQEIGSVLREEGAKVDIVNSRGLKRCDLGPYDFIIVGSGIKVGAWTKSSQKFLRNHKKELENKKVALFVSCSSNRDENLIKDAQEDYLVKVAEKYLNQTPVAMGLFGGVINPHAQYGLMEKMILKMVKKDLEKRGLILVNLLIPEIGMKSVIGRKIF